MRGSEGTQGLRGIRLMLGVGRGYCTHPWAGVGTLNKCTPGWWAGRALPALDAAPQDQDTCLLSVQDRWDGGNEPPGAALIPLSCCRSAKPLRLPVTAVH